MATVTKATAPQLQSGEVPYDLTVDLLARMVDAGLVPRDRHIYLLGGRLYEKMAKTKARGIVGACINVDVVGRRVLVHTSPQIVDGRGEHARVETYRPGQEVPLVLDGREVAHVPCAELLR